MIQLGLQRISRLLANTLLPWRAIHVAGTNGKGSVCNYISSMLEAYNRSEYREKTGQNLIKHGRFTSPHLIDRWDCITVNQETVPYKLFDHIERQVKSRSKQEGIKASGFELLTASAFECFTHLEVDVGIVEVGMGGRLDATNIIGQSQGLGSELDPAMARPPPLVTAITKLGLDHQAFLGNTLEEITKEKAGILKPGVPLIYDESNEKKVKDVLQEEAGKVDSNTDCVSRTTYAPWWWNEVHAYSPHFSGHQKENLAVAFRSTLAALHQLQRMGPLSNSEVTDRKLFGYSRHSKLLADLHCAAEHTQFPGRLQRLDLSALTGREQPILLDGAHNEQSAKVLVDEVDKMRQAHRGSDLQGDRFPRSVTWVLAFSATKDVDEILRIILMPGDTIFAIEFGPVDGMPWVEPMACGMIEEAVRSLGADKHWAAQSGVCTHTFGTRVEEALRMASAKAGDKPLVIAGSLYLVSDVLRLLRDYKRPLEDSKST